MKLRNPSTCGNDENGATLVLVALLLAVMIGITALAVDIGYAIFTKKVGQRAVDAAALSAAAGIPYYNDNRTDTSIRRQRGEQLVTLFNGNSSDPHANIVLGAPLNIATSSLQFVEVDPNTSIYTLREATTEKVNAVRVTQTFQSPTFFAKFFGIPNLPVNSESVAYLPSPGCYTIPFPITLMHVPNHNDLFSRAACGESEGRLIIFSPSTIDTAAWWDYSGGPVNSNDCRNMVWGNNSDTVCIGETINLNNGLDSACFREVAEKVCDGADSAGGGQGPECDVDTPPDIPYDWDGAGPAGPGLKVVVPVVSHADLLLNNGAGNPNQSAPVVGFAEIVIFAIGHDVNGSDPGAIKWMKYYQNCDSIGLGSPGGGGDFNLYSAPKLIANPQSS